MFSRIIYIFNLIISFVTDGIRWIIAFLLIGMVISVLLTVISRYIITISIPWTEELARYLMIWIAFLAGSLGLKKGVHVGIVFLVRKTSPRIKRYIGIISKLSMM
ncbi:MAG: TRAP transporter small permease subunit, partial [Candidatus Atribacteria bacterium]|nr:TRAP transporter small permease subunit [Candidatus Atribacteria bacterium]